MYIESTTFKLLEHRFHKGQCTVLSVTVMTVILAQFHYDIKSVHTMVHKNT